MGSVQNYRNISTAYGFAPPIFHRVRKIDFQKLSRDQLQKIQQHFQTQLNRMTESYQQVVSIEQKNPNASAADVKKKKAQIKAALRHLEEQVKVLKSNRPRLLCPPICNNCPNGNCPDICNICEKR